MFANFKPFFFLEETKQFLYFSKIKFKSFFHVKVI